MSADYPLDLIPIGYLDRNGDQCVFSGSPEPPTGGRAGLKLAFVIRQAQGTTSPDGVDHVFQFDLVECNGEWRVDVMDQLENTNQFGRCGLPEQVILAVDRRLATLDSSFNKQIRSSTNKDTCLSSEFRTPKATKVWDRLKALVASSKDYRVEYNDVEDIYRLVRLAAGNAITPCQAAFAEEPMRD